MSDDKYKSVFADNLNKLMRIKGITQTDIINDLKINKSTISTWCNGSRLPRMDKVQLIADYLGVSKSDLIEEKETKEEAINCNNIYKLDKIKLPMLGKVACGEPIFADEDRESYIMIGTDIGADFCLQCQGDSMINARIHDGDIVFVKRFFYYREQNLVILKPENPKYQDIILTGEQLNQVKVIGRAVAFQSDVI